MKIFLTGSTGFVGKQLLKDLINNNYHVKCLVRHKSEKKIQHLLNKKTEIVYGDITKPDSLNTALKDCDIVINIVGIIREFPKKGITFEKLHYEGTANLVKASQSHGIKKFIQMSALGARHDARTKYQQTKYRAEECVKKSGIDYTIFRPSIIFGKEDKFVNVFANMLETKQFVPVIGNGKYKMQPVALENVTQAFTISVERSNTNRKIFEVGGPEKIEFNKIIDIIGSVLHLQPYKLHVPVWLMTSMAYIFDRLSFFPVTREQIIMLIESNTCNEKPFFDQFGIEPVYFQNGITKYLS